MMGSLRDAIAEAVAGTESEGTEVTEATEEETAAPPDAEAEGVPQGHADDGEEAGSEAPDEGTDDTPTEYFGLDLSGLEPELRASIVEELRKRDDYIGRLLREKSTSELTTEQEEVLGEAEEEISDEEILKLLGLDPENNPWDEQTAKIAVPLFRRQLEQERSIAALIEMQELAEIDRTWRSTLSALEKEFGPLPKEITHDMVMEFAAEEGIASPLDAYWRIMGPARTILSKAVDEAKTKKAAAKPKPQKPVMARPSAEQAAEEDIPLGGEVRDATRKVAKDLLAKLGLS
jgi:hypothetical protein